jgi:hypothetical protein
MADQRDRIPLPDVPAEVCMHRAVDTEAAQDSIVEAHQLGELDLKIRRPDGSIEDLSRDIWQPNPWTGATGRELFSNGGIVRAERPRRGMRRVGPEELCRAFATRGELDRFLGIEAPQDELDVDGAPSPKPFNAKTARDFVASILKADPNATMASVREAAKGRGNRKLIDQEYRHQKGAGGPLKRGPRAPKAIRQSNSAK